ncbi:MAG: alpha/beta hydrolase [Alphaproteobacteria bacterium]|nr:alpha/beta hydrolase [Alphaproteobacteria bacterium]
MPEGLLRAYDDAELERQYNPRIFTPDSGPMADRATELSVDYLTRAGKSAQDIAYGSRKGETVDLFLPENAENAENAPVEMYIHGGYWRARDKTDFSFMAEPIVNAGGICAVVNYDLCPDVSLDEIVRQMRAATAWLYQNAANFGGDPERIHITGHSAGGHLTAMVAETAWPTFDASLPADLVKSAIPVSGVFELTPIAGMSVQEAIQLDDAGIERNSPLRHPIPGAPKMAVTVGGAESEEFKKQSEAYAAHARAQGSTVEHFEIPGKNHFTILTDTTAPDYALTEVRLRFMGLA